MTVCVPNTAILYIKFIFVYRDRFEFFFNPAPKTWSIWLYIRLGIRYPQNIIGNRGMNSGPKIIGKPAIIWRVLTLTLKICFAGRNDVLSKRFTMFFLMTPLITYAVIAFTTALFFYYGVFRPLCSLLRFFVSLFYYAVMLAGFYFLFTTFWPPSSKSDQQMDAIGRNDSLSGDVGQALRGLGIDFLFKAVKGTLKAVARFVVTVLD